jgi:hypothetical protein
MDLRQYSAGPLKPDDVRGAPRTDRIINVYVHEKYDCPVLELESGDTFFLNATNGRILGKAWGFDSADWHGQELEFSLGSYKDWRTDPPTDKETVTVRAVSPAKAGAQNGGAARPAPSKAVVAGGPASLRGEMDDEIPFAPEWR